MTPIRTNSAALIMAHPGHELRIHEWVCRHRPTVFILTDGSGGTAEPRIEASRRLLTDAGCTIGSVFGRMPDREAYAAIAAGTHQLFLDLVDEIVVGLVAGNADLVVCDAAEGYNTIHDVCRVMAAVAASVAGNEIGRELPLYEFPLVGAPDAVDSSDAIRLHLDDAEFARKLCSAEQYSQLDGELAAAVQRHGRDAFRVEALVPADCHAAVQPTDDPPFYETYGEQQVAAGRYREVIRWREHIQPLVEAVRAAHSVARDH